MKSVIKNTIPLSAGLVLHNLLYFLSVIFCVRFFTEETAAKIILLYYAHIILILLSDFGILAGNGYGVKYIVNGKNPAEKKKRSGELLVASTCITVLLVLVFFSVNRRVQLFPALQDVLVDRTVLLFLFWVLGHNICKFTVVILNSFESGWGILAGIVPVEIIRLGVLIGARESEKPFHAILLWMAVGYLVLLSLQLCFLAIYLARKNCLPVITRQTWRSCLSIIHKSIFYYLPWLSIFILVPIANFFLASQGNMAAVTLFTVGSQFASPVLLAVVPFNFALFPYLVRSSGQDVNITNLEFRRIMIAIIGLMISYTLFIGGFGQAIYMFLAKKEASEVIAVALILLAGYSTDIFRCITDPILNMKNREKLVTVAELAKPASLITVLLVAGREYGALAGAAGLALGCLLASLIKAHGIRAISCYNFYWPMAGSFTAASLLCFFFFSL